MLHSIGSRKQTLRHSHLNNGSENSISVTYRNSNHDLEFFSPDAPPTFAQSKTCWCLIHLLPGLLITVGLAIAGYWILAKYFVVAVVILFLWAFRKSHAQATQERIKFASEPQTFNISRTAFAHRSTEASTRRWPHASLFAIEDLDTRFRLITGAGRFVIPKSAFTDHQSVEDFSSQCQKAIDTPAVFQSYTSQLENEAYQTVKLATPGQAHAFDCSPLSVVPVQRGLPPLMLVLFCVCAFVVWYLAMLLLDSAPVTLWFDAMDEATKDIPDQWHVQGVMILPLFIFAVYIPLILLLDGMRLIAVRRNQQLLADKDMSKYESRMPTPAVNEVPQLSVTKKHAIWTASDFEEISNWSLFARVREDDDFIAIDNRRKQIGFVIPKSQFKTDELSKRFVSTVSGYIEGANSDKATSTT